MGKYIKIVVVAIISSISLCANAQVVSDKTRDELKGSVSSCTTRVFKAVDKFGEITKGELSSEETIVYDNKGFKLSDSKYHYENSYTPAGKISVIDRYVGSALNQKRKFNHQSLKTTETVYGQDGSREDYIVWTKNKSVAGDNPCFKTTTYNAAGAPVKYVEACDGRSIKICIYSYNAKGGLQTIKTTYPDFYNQNYTLTYSQYKYDAKGNWIYRVIRDNGDVIAIVEREIEY